MRRYLRGAKWGPVEAFEHDHGRIAMPVRLIWGADDQTFPVEYARKMVKQFPTRTSWRFRVAACWYTRRNRPKSPAR